jgi:hypothetical protein
MEVQIGFVAALGGRDGVVTSVVTAIVIPCRMRLSAMNCLSLRVTGPTSVR